MDDTTHAAKVGAPANAAYHVFCKLPVGGKREYLFVTFDLAKEWMLKMLPKVEAQAGEDIREYDSQFPRMLEAMEWPQIRAHVEALEMTDRFTLKCYTDSLGYRWVSLTYRRVETCDFVPE